MTEINTSAKLFLILGSANALLAVMLGAFGAHALKNKLDEAMLTVYQTGSEYHFYHSLGLMLVGILAMQLQPGIWLKLSGWSMFAGILLFCGSLYMLSILGMRWLGMITPVGGTLFILAWTSLCIAIFKQ